ncbi:MAG: PepSY domain-containing protein [Bosea sp. (in: a-proteobacteria)]
MVLIYALAAITLVTSPVLAAADTNASLVCLSQEEMREAVSGRHVVDPAQASRHARDAASGEVVRIRLCRQGDELFYLVTTLKRDGRVSRVMVEGNSGKVSTVR